MKKIFFLLASLFLLFGNICQAKDIKFVQVTDVQYGAEGSQQILEDTIKDINNMPDIDFVVFTGDNTASANEEWMTEFVNTAKKLNKPFYINVGDKDMSKSKGLQREEYALKLHKMLGRKSPKSTNYTFQLKRTKTLFIVVDGAKDFIIMPNGYFSDSTMEWLENTIKQNQDKKIVILQHFPVAIRTSNDFYYTANAPKYLKMLNQYDNVISVISGHFNKNEEKSYNGVYHIVTPSLTQKKYKIIEIDEEDGYQIFTTLVKMDE